MPPLAMLRAIEPRLILFGPLSIGKRNGATFNPRDIRAREELFDGDIFLQHGITRVIGDPETTNAKNGNQLVFQEHRFQWECICILGLRHDP